ncbi:MAG: type II CAAX endopeptidase family protein [Polyangiaceae bacterium]
MVVSDPKPLWKRVTEFPLIAMLIALVLALGAITLANIIAKSFPAMPTTEGALVNGSFVLCILLVTYHYGIAKLGAEPRDDFRFGHAARDVGGGLVLGFILFATVVGIAALLGVYAITGAGDTNQLLVALMTIAIVPGVAEELLFRGILFRWLEQFGGTWAALLLTSALFGAAHFFNPNATAFSSFALACEAGLLLGGAYMLTRSLWMPVGLHAAWNFTQGEIFDVPVSGFDQRGLVEAKLSGHELLSGGTFGLEASIIALFVATGCGLWLIWLAVQRGHTERPYWVRRRLIRSKEAIGIDVHGDADLGAPLDPA